MPTELDKIIDLIQKLRGSSQPCHWTKAQTFSSLKNQTLEEVYELIDAIEENNDKAILDELGDMLYHIIFYIQIAQELSLFSFNDVVHSILDKHHRRLPSPDERIGLSKEQLEQFWERAKRIERTEQNKALADKVKYLPALLSAQKLLMVATEDKKPTGEAIFSEIQSRLQTLKNQEKEHQDLDTTHSKFGKLLFSCVKLAQYLDIDPEEALRIANKNVIQKRDLYKKP